MEDRETRGNEAPRPPLTRLRQRFMFGLYPSLFGNKPKHRQIQNKTHIDKHIQDIRANIHTNSLQILIIIIIIHLIIITASV